MKLSNKKRTWLYNLSMEEFQNEFNSLVKHWESIKILRNIPTENLQTA